MWHHVGDTDTKKLLIITSDIFICDITSALANQKYFKTSLSSY